MQRKKGKAVKTSGKVSTVSLLIRDKTCNLQLSLLKVSSGPHLYL